MWLGEYIMILMYSFFNSMETILELIFKNTSSKQQSKTLTLSHYALKKTGTLSLFIRIASVDNQLRMSGTVQMIWRILSPSVTLVSISTFSPKRKVLELTYNIYPDKKNHHSHIPRFNTFFTRGSSKTLSGEAWNLSSKSWFDIFMSSNSSTSRIMPMSLSCEAH